MARLHLTFITTLLTLGATLGCENSHTTTKPDAQVARDSGSGGDAGQVCEPGRDQTCNDNPIHSSLHGKCEADGTCTCSGFQKNPTTGRCL